MRISHKGKLLDQIRQNPTVKEVYHDSDGWWMEPKRGFRNSYDDPSEGDGCLHGAHEMTLRELKRRLPFTPCNCKDCQV